MVSEWKSMDLIHDTTSMQRMKSKSGFFPGSKKVFGGG